MSKSNQNLLDQLQSMLEKLTDFHNEVKATDASKIIQEDRLQLTVSEINPKNIAENNKNEPEKRELQDINNSSVSYSSEHRQSKNNKKASQNEIKYISQKKNNSYDMDSETSSSAALPTQPAKQTQKSKKATNDETNYNNKNSNTEKPITLKSIYDSDDSVTEKEKARIQASFYAKGIDVDSTSSDSEVESVLAKRREESLKKANDSSSVLQSDSSNRRLVKKPQKSPVQTQKTQTDDSIISSSTPKGQSKSRKSPKVNKESDSVNQKADENDKEQKKKFINKTLQLAKRYDNRKLRRSQGITSSKRGTDDSDLSGFDSTSSSATPRQEKSRKTPSPSSSVSSLSSVSKQKSNQKQNQSILDESNIENSPKRSPKSIDKYRVKSFLDSDNSDEVNPIAALTKTLDALHSSSDSDDSIIFIKPKPDTIPFPRVTEDGIIEEYENDSEFDNKNEFQSSEDKLNLSSDKNTDDDIEFKPSGSLNGDEHDSNVVLSDDLISPGSNIDINSDIDIDNDDEKIDDINNLINDDLSEHNDSADEDMVNLTNEEVDSLPPNPKIDNLKIDAAKPVTPIESDNDEDFLGNDDDLNKFEIEEEEEDNDILTNDKLEIEEEEEANDLLTNDQLENELNPIDDPALALDIDSDEHKDQVDQNEQDDFENEQVLNEADENPENDLNDILGEDGDINTDDINTENRKEDGEKSDVENQDDIGIDDLDLDDDQNGPENPPDTNEE